MRKLALLLLINSCVYNSANAQEQRLSGWLMGVSTIKLNTKFLFQFDAQLRSSDKWEKSETLILRPLLSYLLNKETAVGLGYASVSNWRTIDGIRDRVDEQRLWQQLNINRLRGNMAIQHRFRLEERWLPEISVENREFIKKGYAFSSRMRYFSRIMQPLKKTVQFKQGWYWAAQNELFFNLWGAAVVNKKLFDQSRTYAGCGFRLHKGLDVELGYMFTFIEGRGDRYVRNNITQLSSFLRL